MIRAVIFDLDDTLYSERMYVKSGFEAIGKSMPQFKGISKKLWKSFLVNHSPIDAVLKNENIYSEELLKEMVKVYQFHKPSIRLHQGILEMFGSLKNEGKKTGLITDGRPEGQRAKIEALDIEKYLDKIIVTDELGGPVFRKPNQLAFVLMRDALEVEFSEMIYVADNPLKDFIAPEKLGMSCLHYLNPVGIYKSESKYDKVTDPMNILDYL